MCGIGHTSVSRAKLRRSRNPSVGRSSPCRGRLAIATVHPQRETKHVQHAQGEKAAGQWVVGRGFGVHCTRGAGVGDAFRGGDINYAQIGATTSTNASFQSTVSYRCTAFFASCPAVGTPVSIGGMNFGDGTFSPGTYDILASNAAEDNFTAREITSHSYADLTRRTAEYSSCCTISTLLNNNDASHRTFAIVDLAQDPQSPRTSVPPVVNVGSSGVQTFSVAASDPGGQTLRWRLATDAETLGFQSNPPDFSVNASTGQASFDTTGKTQGLYHAYRPPTPTPATPWTSSPARCPRGRRSTTRPPTR